MLFRSLQNAELEIASLRPTVGSLQQLQAIREQDTMKNDLEIVGIPEHENENLTHIVLTTSQKIGVELCETDIAEITRAGPKRNSRQTLSPRPIVLRLLRKQKRDDMVRAAKARRNITTENAVGGEPKAIFINERLTKENRRLFREARICAKENKF